MVFYSYEGVSDSELDKQHTTSTGETYSLRHNENLKIEMPYLGKGNSNANSQGWERNSSKYFDALYRNHPEMFSKKNVERIKAGHAPIVDQKMISSNPNWVQFRNQALIHHHIGGNGEAVAVPENAHKGQGEIHNPEKAAGITNNCKNFSNKCSSNPNSVGKTTSQLHAEMESKSNKNVKAKNAYDTKSTIQPHNLNTSNSPSTRSDAIRSIGSSKRSSSFMARSQSVRDSECSASSTSLSNRIESVRKSTQSTNYGRNNKSSLQSSADGNHSNTSNQSR